jgi:hypothetical protein
MSDSRERFEAWRDAQHKYLEPADFWPWIEEAWMQAEAGAARRCAEICEYIVGCKEGAAEAAMDIRAEFPEAFK